MVWLRYLSILLPAVGLAVAGHLSINHFYGLDAACIVGQGCTEVATWAAANIKVVPLPYAGLFGYVVLLIMALYGLVAKKDLSLPGLLISGVGTLVSLVLMYISFFVVKATCLYCITSAVVMTGTFIAYLGLRKNPQTGPPTGADTGVVLFAAVGAAIAMFLSNASAMGKLADVPDGTIDNYILANPKLYGNRDAEITILEFFSFTCPHCRSTFPQIKEIIDKSNGRARLVMVACPFINRDGSPYQGHEFAVPAAAIGQMAHEKGKFFDYVREVFRFETNSLDMNKLQQAAVNVGLDKEEILKRMQNADKDPAFVALGEEIAMSGELGVELTPTYFVGRKGSRIEVLTMTNVVDVLSGERYLLPKPADLAE